MLFYRGIFGKEGFIGAFKPAIPGRFNAPLFWEGAFGHRSLPEPAGRAALTVVRIPLISLSDSLPVQVSFIPGKYFQTIHPVHFFLVGR